MKKRTFPVLACCLLTLLMLALQTAARPGHPGSWEGLSARHDLDGDGIITAEEFAASDPRFATLDHNGDGVLTEDDLEALRADRGSAAGARITLLADGDRDRAVTAEEWRLFLETVDSDGDGLFEAADLRAVAAERRSMSDRPRHRGPRGEGGPEDGAFAEILDRDHDGVLEIADLDDIYFELDADGDGALSEEELPMPPFFGRGTSGRGGFGGRGRP